MGEVFTGRQNRNETRNYPLHDRATRIGVDGTLLPNTILADAHLAVPRSAGTDVFVSSVGISEHLISITFMAGWRPIWGVAHWNQFKWGTWPIALGAVTVQKPVTLYRNYPVTALYPGFGGWVAFGAGVEDIDALNIRFNDPTSGLLAAKAVHNYDVPPVRSLGSTENTLQLMGLVHLQGQPGLVRVQKEIRTIDGINREVLAIGLDTAGAADPVSLLLRYAGPCGRPEQRNCPAGKALRTINGVAPDCHGNIRIRVEGLDATVTGITAGTPDNKQASGNIIDLPIGLDDVCSVLDPSRIFDADLCAPSSSSSSESSSSSSEPSSSSSSSSPSGSLSSYCDYFNSAAYTFDNMEPQQGTWSVANVVHAKETTGRLLSAQGMIGPQVIINDGLWKAPDIAPYRIEGTIRPLTENGNGHLIFGYKNIDDFWFAGISLRPQTDVNGLLYVGRKTAPGTTVLDNWPNGLDNGYFFTRTITPDGSNSEGIAPDIDTNGLFNTDVRVVVEVYPVAPGSAINIVQVGYEWDGTHGLLHPSGEPTANIVFSVSPSDSDMAGYAGLGTVGSKTEFDDFGIDCDDWISSSSSSSFGA